MVPHSPGVALVTCGCVTEGPRAVQGCVGDACIGCWWLCGTRPPLGCGMGLHARAPPGCT